MIDKIGSSIVAAGRQLASMDDAIGTLRQGDNHEANRLFGQVVGRLGTGCGDESEVGLPVLAKPVGRILGVVPFRNPHGCRSFMEREHTYSRTMDQYQLARVIRLNLLIFAEILLAEFL